MRACMRPPLPAACTRSPPHATCTLSVVPLPAWRAGARPCGPSSPTTRRRSCTTPDTSVGTVSCAQANKGCPARSTHASGLHLDVGRSLKGVHGSQHVTLHCPPCAAAVRDYRRNNKYTPRTVDTKTPLDLEKASRGDAAGGRCTHCPQYRGGGWEGGRALHTGPTPVLPGTPCTLEAVRRLGAPAPLQRSPCPWGGSVGDPGR